MNGQTEALLQGIEPELPAQTPDEPQQVEQTGQLPEGYEQDLADIRAGHATEAQDPEVLAKLYYLTHNEVGGQGPEARQAFMETVFNRAAARGATLADTINDRRYYPQESYRRTSIPSEDVANYNDAFKNVVYGSNLSRNATGNASGNVGFNRGIHTFTAGGERFGIEGPDVGWRGPSAMQAAAYTGKSLEGITGEDINAIIQQYPRIAGEPTAGSIEAAQGEQPAMTQPAEEPSALESVAGDIGGASYGGNEITTGDGLVPSAQHAKRTNTLADGTIEYNGGSAVEGGISYHPNTDTLVWKNSGRTLTKQGEYGPTHGYAPNIKRNPDTGEYVDFSSGVPVRVDMPDQSPAFDPSMSKDGNLARLSPQDAALVEQAANYQMPMMTKFGRVNPTFMRLLPYVKAVNPSINMLNYQIRQQTMLEMASDKSNSPGGRLGSWNQALIHAGNLWDLASQLPEGNLPAGNTVANWINTNVKGLPAEKNFESQAHFFANEVEKAITGGVPSVSEVDKLEKSLSAAGSKAQVEGVLKNVFAKTISGGLERVNFGYKRNMGTDYPTEKLIAPEAADSLNKFGLHTFAGRDIRAMQGYSGEGATPAAAPMVSHGAAYDAAQRVLSDPNASPQHKALAEAAMERYRRETQTR